MPSVSKASPFLTGSAMVVLSNLEIRAHKSFEQGRDGGCVFSGSLASPVKGGIKSRRMHQMHPVKLGANKGGRL